MSDLLAIALTGVRTYQRALDVVADNVANSATPGHVRRTANLAAIGNGVSRSPLELDMGTGHGVRLEGVGRAADMLGLETLRRAEGEVAALDAANRWVSAIQSALVGAASVDQPMQDLFASLSDLASDPADLAVRATFLERAATLAERFNLGGAALERLDQDLMADARNEVKDLNALLKGLADINAQSRRASPQSNASALLADQRDRLLARISTYVPVTVTIDARGQASIRTPDAGGPLLVEGETVRPVRLVDAPEGFALRVGPSGNDEPAAITGGSLKGLTTARQLLTASESRLDDLAHVLATEMNLIHSQGVDLAGHAGKPLFSTTTARVTVAAGNGGSAIVTAELADGATPGPLSLIHDGTTGEWILSRADGSATVSGALPLSLDGATVDARGAPMNGDLFSIELAHGARALSLRPVTESEVAAAPPFVADRMASNLSGAGVEWRPAAALVPPATGPFTLEAMADGLFELRDSAGVLLGSGLAGDWIAGDGFEARASGNSMEGDRFMVRATGPGSGSGGNAIALLGLEKGMAGGASPAARYDRMVTGISVPLSEIRIRADVAEISRDTAAESLQASSGVDLNTEAAEMLRLQQAYQANARIIQTARETFDAILAVGR